MSDTTPFLRAEKRDGTRSMPSDEMQATWRDIIPAHRLPVIIKTPLMIASGAYLAHAEFDGRTVGVGMALGAALWATLYPFNEATDLLCERQMRLPRFTWAIFAALLTLIEAGAWFLVRPLALPFALMILSQCLYCAPGIRWKRDWRASVFLSGTLNPLLRIWCGALLGALPISPFVYVILVALHVASSLRARALLRDRDTRLGYTAAPHGIETLGAACTIIGLLGALFVFVSGKFPPIFYLFFVVASGFSIYAWSGRVTSMAELRKGWALFAALSLIALIALFLNR